MSALGQMQTLRSGDPENAASSYKIAHFRLDFGSEQSVSSGVKGAAMDAEILANTPDDVCCESVSIRRGLGRAS